MRTSKKSQSGRSLLEMLMVLGVMAILTIGGIAGYKTLSTRFETRTVGEAITRHVVQRQHEAMGKLGRQEHLQSNVEGPHGVYFDLSNDITNHLITIKTKSENSDLIEALADSELLKGTAYSIDAPVFGESESYVVMKFKQYQHKGVGTDSAITCSVGTVGGTGEATVLASDNSTQCYCEEEKRFIGGECVACSDVDNYKADGSETTDGQVCCPSGYSSAVGGTCCKDDENIKYCKQVNYLESSGTQYIDTGLLANGNYNVLIDFQFNTCSSNDKWIYGWWTSFYTKDAIIGVFNNKFRMYIGNDVSSSYVNMTCDTNRHTAGWQNGKYVYDSQNITIVPDLNVTTSEKIYIFARYNQILGLSSKIYSVKMWSKDNSTLVRDFIPVIDKRGKAGMYDKVSGQMFYDPNDKKFSAG